MLTRVALICVGVLIAAQVHAQAYTDPGSGTLIWQMLLAASFGLMFYLRRIIGWVQRFRSAGNKSRSEEVNATPLEEPESVND
jgi:hypothetical protein